MHYRCKGCGAAMPANQTGRRKQYHSDACRIAARRRSNDRFVTNDRLPSVSPTDADVCSETALQPIDFAEAKISEKNATPLRFEEVNKATLKLVGDETTTVPACHGHWGGYKTAKALAWVINVAPGQWLARYKDRAIGPSSLAKAKSAAMSMAMKEAKGQPVSGDISYINRLACDRPSATMSINDDCTFKLDLRWGADWSATFPHSEYPEDDAAYTLYAWSYRKVVSLRWSSGKVATFITPRQRPSNVEVAAEAQSGVTVPDTLIAAPMASLVVDNTNPYLAQVEAKSDIPTFLDRRRRSCAVAA